MGSKDDTIESQGTILEGLPGNKFKVELDNGHEIIAYVGGKMRVHSIKIMPGDKVDVVMTPYDLTTGRITYRYRKGQQ